MSVVKPHFKDFNTWNEIDSEEIERLQSTLAPHLKKIGIIMSKPKRIDFVKQLLERQNGTCIWGKENMGKYCWNEPKYNWTTDENGEKYESICNILKLQWGHLIPRCRGEKFDEHTLCLMCGRCNNHIQSSRKLEQLVPELLSKVSEIIEKDVCVVPTEEERKALVKLNEYYGYK
jgi:hypothetical protein